MYLWLNKIETNIQPQSKNIFDPIERLLIRRPIILQLLKFGAIGVINAALDFLILNLISKSLGIDKGLRLGLLSAVSFAFANIQSYYWNRSWAFGQQDTGVLKSFFRLIVIGTLGSAGVLAVFLGAQFVANPVFYLLVLTAFIILQILVWHWFNLHATGAQGQSSFALFFVVSLIGLGINAVCVAVFSSVLSDSATAIGNPDVLKNVAKIIATLASLVWNFVGYKLIVFRK